MDVKDELSRVLVISHSARRAQVAVLLRFAGRLRMLAGQVVVEAEVATELVAARLRTDIVKVYGHTATMRSDVGGQDRRYVVCVHADAEMLGRQVGLLDRLGRPVRGLPAWVVAGPAADAAAVWRAAFMAAGSLSAPGQVPVLRIECPSMEAAMAMVGAARRLGVKATITETEHVFRVAVRDAEQIGVLLERMGAHSARAAREQDWVPRRRAAGSRSRGGANRRRAEQAGAAACAQAQRALAALGDDAPAELAAAGRLRIAHPRASLEELGRYADPPISKDAVAGRIRRLVAMADRAARRGGNTAAGNTTSAAVG